MRSIKQTVFLSAVSTLGAASAHAQEASASGPYFGATVGSVNISESFLNTSPRSASFIDSANISTMGGRVGYTFNKHLAVEAEGMAGLNTQSFVDSLSGQTADVSLESLFGAYAVGSMPLGERFRAFAKVGAVNINIDREVPNSSGFDKVSKTSGAVGLGAAMSFGALDAVLEYTHHAHSEGSSGAVLFSVMVHP